MSADRYIGTSYYKDIDGVTYRYVLKTTPPEKVYHETYKARPCDVVIITDVTDEERRRVRAEIAKDINEEVDNDRR